MRLIAQMEAELSELERLKTEAVSVEDYELAASLRDQIAALKSSEAPTKQPEPGQKAAHSARPDKHPDYPDLGVDGYMACPLFPQVVCLYCDYLPT